MHTPQCYIIAGPNGAGKTTAAHVLLPEFLHCNEFVNADAIAAGLSPFNVESVAIQAGRLMLARMRYLAENKISFAFETTLASKSFVPFIKQLQAQGYEVSLIFLYLQSFAVAQERVELRVLSGGHAIPSNVIRRRYASGIKNFFEMYAPLVDSWRFFDNSLCEPQLLASCEQGQHEVYNDSIWQRVIGARLCQ